MTRLADLLADVDRAGQAHFLTPVCLVPNGLPRGKGARVASRPGAAYVSPSRTRGRNGRVSTVETIDVTRQESASLFDATFWLECEREAARILAAITGVDE